MMAWNPSPQVRAARAAANAIGGIYDCGVNHMILLFTLDGDRIGYASYGSDRTRCGVAKRLADRAFEVVQEEFEEHLESHHRHDWHRLGPEGIDWDGMRHDVCQRLDALRLLCENPELDPTARHSLMRDVLLPVTELLGRFCSCCDMRHEDQSA